MLLYSQCGLRAETVADGLGQSRPIHLPCYTGDDPSFILARASLFQRLHLL
jgi:hypothetical protein